MKINNFTRRQIALFLVIFVSLFFLPDIYAQAVKQATGSVRTRFIAQNSQNNNQGTAATVPSGRNTHHPQGAYSQANNDVNPKTPSRDKLIIPANPYAGKPSVIYPQDTVDERFRIDESSGQKVNPGPFFTKLLSHTRTSNNPRDDRPIRPYVDLGPLMEMFAEHPKEEQDNFMHFIYSPAEGSAIWLITKAMTDQGYDWEKADPTVEKLFFSLLDKYRLPSLGRELVHESSGFVTHPAQTDPHSGSKLSMFGRTGPFKPQLSLQYSPLTSHTSNMHPKRFAIAVAHEFEHSTQLLPWISNPYEVEKDFSGARLWGHSFGDGNKEIRQAVNEKISSPYAVMEIPAVFVGFAMYSAAFRGQTGKELDVTLVFPSGKEVYLPWIEQMARQHHFFTPDPQRGTTYTMTELMSTQTGKKWISDLIGAKKGTAYMGEGENRISAPWWPAADSNGVMKGMIKSFSQRKRKEISLTPEAVELSKENPTVSEFLRKIGVNPFQAHTNN